MSGLDHSLIYEARKFITGANVHYVNTWIFCYESSALDSGRNKRYEKILREFVATRRVTLVARADALQARVCAKDIRRLSDVLNRYIDEKGDKLPLAVHSKINRPV